MTQHRHDPDVITLLVDTTCPDGNTCRAILDTGDPEHLHLVVTDETDPMVLARLASRVGTDERLVRWPRRLGLPRVLPS